MVVQDIMISGAPEMPKECMKIGRLNHMHIANRFRYSLRVSSRQWIPYLQLTCAFSEWLTSLNMVRFMHLYYTFIYQKTSKSSCVDELLNPIVLSMISCILNVSNIDHELEQAYRFELENWFRTHLVCTSTDKTFSTIFPIKW
jgi:hypothetical protein